MKNLIFILIIIVGLFSCSEKHPLATKLCDCYDKLHRASLDRDISYWSDSCNILYIDILNNLEEKLKEKKQFFKAYKLCQ